VLGSIQWVDVAGRSLRRTWITHWRRQSVEVLPLADPPTSLSPPPPPPRAVRSPHPWGWQDRLPPRACRGPPPVPVSCPRGPPVPCHCRGSPRLSRHELTKEELANKEAFSIKYHFPLSGSGGPGSSVDFQLPPSLLSLLACCQLVAHPVGNPSSVKLG